MASAETELTLEADEWAVVSFLDEHGGHLLREAGNPMTYWLVLRPQAAPAETFYARLEWSRYTDAPPSVRFHDGIGGPSDVASAWPQIAGYRIGSWDICKPFTAEGFSLHPDWRDGPTAWNPAGNPFLWVVQTLQFDFNHAYQGRAS